MALTKIISAGLTDTERTALKVVRHSTIAYGVSIDPIRDADGILIITNGPFTFQLKKIGDSSKRQNKPCLHLNLKKTGTAQAPYEISQWLSDNNIQTLYVTGPNQNDTPDIIEATLLVLNGLLIFNEMPDPEITEGIAGEILTSLSLREKSDIAKMEAIELDTMQRILDRYAEEKSVQIQNGRAVMKSLWRKLRKSHRLRLVD